MERATVVSSSSNVSKVREGRGYSLAELREVGLDGFEAVRRGIPYDKSRTTKHDENVKRLSEMLKKK